jgi:hypothetical protein
MTIAAEHPQTILYMTMSVNLHTKHSCITHVPPCYLWMAHNFILSTHNLSTKATQHYLLKSLISCFMAKRWRINCNAVPVHAINLCTGANGGTDPLILTLSTTWGVNVQVHATVALTSREGALWTHWIGSRVVPRGDLDTLEKSQISCLRLTSHNTTHYAHWAIPALNPVSYSRHYVAEQHYCPLTRSTGNLWCQESTRAFWNRERSCL